MQLLVSYLTAELGDDNVRYDQRQHSAHILVQKMAGSKSVSGTFVIKGNDSLSQSGQTLVTMKRAKVNWRRRLRGGADARDQSCTGGRFGGPSSGISGSSRMSSGGTRTSSRMCRDVYNALTM